MVVDARGVRRAKSCECKLDRVTPERLNRAKIPPRYKDATFEIFNTRQLPPLENALGFAKTYVDDWVPPVEYGLAFLGPPGVGKTHLAVSVIRELILRKGVECFFVDFRELLQQIRNTFNSETETTEEGLLTPVIECEALVLDELVATKPSDWVKERLAYIINARYNAKRPTIITTTMELGTESKRSPGVGATDDSSLNREWQERESAGKERKQRSLDDFDEFGRQIASRFFEMCKPIVIDGVPDFRKTVKWAANQNF